MSSTLQRVRFTASDYTRMASILAGRRTELIDGEIIEMAPIGTAHLVVVDRLERHLARLKAEGQLQSGQPVRIWDYDEPQPDLALLKPRADDYSTVKATPAEILLLVEVADRTLRTDLGRKARIYATGGVVEYWVVDVNNRVLYVHRAPEAGRYASRQVLGRTDRISALFASEVEFEVAELIV